MLKYNGEKRVAQRLQVLAHAKLRAGEVLVNCVIRDLSQTGAKLGVPSSARLPANSDLWLIQGEARMRVVVKWRDGDFVGVAFSAKSARSGAEPPEPEKPVILDV